MQNKPSAFTRLNYTSPIYIVYEYSTKLHEDEQMHANNIKIYNYIVCVCACARVRVCLCVCVCVCVCVHM